MRRWSVVLLLTLVSAAPDAAAQDAQYREGSRLHVREYRPKVTTGTVTPAKELPSLPKPPEPPAQSMEALPYFPQLPPSRPCRKEDVVGLWKLLQVYEIPAGVELSNFSLNPIQYLAFNLNNTYGRLNAPNEMPPEMAIAFINKHSTALLQYLIQETAGANILYFYQERVANDSQACFIVTNAADPFLQDQMLLMPPKGQIQGRLVKGYVRLWSPMPQAKKENPTPKQRRGYRPQNYR